MNQTERIRILHVVFSLDPGGMENGLINVAERLDPDKYEVHVCCLERVGAFAERFTHKDRVYKLCKTDGFSWRSLYGLHRLLAKVRPHVVHSHNLGSLIYSSLATGYGRRCAIFHGEHGQLRGENLEPRRIKQRHKYYRNCARIHTVSKSLKNHFLEMGFDAERFDVVVNGVDISYYQPGDKLAARRELGYPEDALLVGIFSRFGKYKRHAELLDAFDVLAARIPDMHLLIVGGGGPIEDAVRERVPKSPYQERIHLTGFQQDPRRYYHAVDLVAIPSIVEGLSNAMLEGMATATPALCNSVVCGVEDVLNNEENGLMADVCELDDLVRHLEAAVADRDRLERMGKVARKTIEDEFSIESMTRKYSEIYSELAGEVRV